MVERDDVVNGPLELGPRWDGLCVRCASWVPYEDRYVMYHRQCPHCYNLAWKDD